MTTATRTLTSDLKSLGANKTKTKKPLPHQLPKVTGERAEASKTQAEKSVVVHVTNTMEQVKRVLSHLGVWSFLECLDLDKVRCTGFLPPVACLGTCHQTPSNPAAGNSLGCHCRLEISSTPCFPGCCSLLMDSSGILISPYRLEQQISLRRKGKMNINMSGLMIPFVITLCISPWASASARLVSNKL